MCLAFYEVAQGGPRGGDTHPPRHNMKWFTYFNNTQYETWLKKAFTLDRIKNNATPMAQLITDIKLKDTNEQDYFSIDLSLKVFDKWCNNLGIDKNQFVTDLFNVLHKREPKINTFCIHGPQNTGKSYILRSIREIVKYYGEIHAGVLHSYKDDLHRGANIHKSDQLLRPPPVIITTNNTLWKNASSQKGPCMARMKYYVVTTEQQWLLHLKKNLNPKIWPTLFRNTPKRAS